MIILALVQQLIVLSCVEGVEENLYKERTVIVPDDAAWWDNLTITTKTTESGVVGLFKCSALCSTDDQCTFFTFDKTVGSCILMQNLESILEVIFNYLQIIF